MTSEVSVDACNNTPSCNILLAAQHARTHPNTPLAAQHARTHPNIPLAAQHAHAHLHTDALAALAKHINVNAKAPEEVVKDAGVLPAAEAKHLSLNSGLRKRCRDTVGAPRHRCRSRLLQDEAALLVVAQGDAVGARKRGGGAAALADRDGCRLGQGVRLLTTRCDGLGKGNSIDLRQGSSSSSSSTAAPPIWPTTCMSLRAVPSV